MGGVPVFTLAVVGCTLAGFGVTSAAGVNPAWAAFAGAAVLAVRALRQHRTTPAALGRAAGVPFLAFVVCLGIVVQAVVAGGLPDAGHGAYAGLLGRGRPDRDPGTRMEALAGVSAGELLGAAARRLGAPCERAVRRGRVEREVVLAASGADLLILARDGDRSKLGPRSLGQASRFVVDHAPCPVLLVWPEPAPGVKTIPPPPPPKRHGRGHGHP